MLCLGIETSCDETALALVRDGKLVASVLASQADTHSLFGGVVPELASREHYRYIGPLYDMLLAQNGIDQRAVELIAVTRGPGLLGCILVGLAFAKGLALGVNIPLVGVNHLHAHLLAAGLERPLAFPALGLLVSGGHTHLYHMHSHTKFTLLGRTLDDAAGEACDKFAKMLGLPYPGGAMVDKLSQGAAIHAKLFPRPYTNNESLDFSYSGLKTAAATYLAKHPELVEAGHAVRQHGLEAASVGLREVCASYLHAVADTLRLKTEKALNLWQGDVPQSLVVAGGVAANSHVRTMLAQTATRHGIELVLPSLKLCTDNAAMIAYSGECLYKSGRRHDLRLSAIPRGKNIPDDYLQVIG